VRRRAGRFVCSTGAQGIPFASPATHLKGSQRPRFPSWRQGSVLVVALVHPPGIIVAITLMRRCVTPKSTPWRLISRRHRHQNYPCGASKDSESPKLGADFSRGCAYPVIAHTFLMTHPPPPHNSRIDVRSHALALPSAQIYSGSWSFVSGSTPSKHFRDERQPIAGELDQAWMWRLSYGRLWPAFTQPRWRAALRLGRR
jgi:hypothetical protein